MTGMKIKNNIPWHVSNTITTLAHWTNGISNLFYFQFLLLLSYLVVSRLQFYTSASIASSIPMLFILEEHCERCSETRQ